MKAQSSIEFSLILAFMIIVFATMMVVIGNKTVETQQQKEFKTIQHFADVLKAELDFAGKTVPGYSRKIEIPSELDGAEYAITIVDGTTLNADFSLLTVKYLSYREGEYTLFTTPDLHHEGAQPYMNTFSIGSTNYIRRGETSVCISTDTVRPCP